MITIKSKNGVWTATYIKAGETIIMSDPSQQKALKMLEDKVRLFAAKEFNEFHAYLASRDLLINDSIIPTAEKEKFNPERD